MLSAYAESIIYTKESVELDNIAIALTNDAALRVYSAVTTDMSVQAQKLHKSYPVATAALGRTLTAASMMGAMLKSENTSITIQIKGNGPLGAILAVSDDKSNVRGYVSNPDVEMPLRGDGKLDVGGAVGKEGFVNVVRENPMGQPYSGSVALVSGEIAEDITSYYAISEQIPTAMGLGVLVGTDGVPIASGGFLIQLMPGTGENDAKILEEVENNLKLLPSVTDMVKSGLGTDGIIERLLKGIDYNILENRKVGYKCNCSVQRVERALISIGEKDLQSLVDEGKESEVNCSFCDKKYVFSMAQLSDLLRRSKKI